MKFLVVVLIAYIQSDLNLVTSSSTSKASLDDILPYCNGLPNNGQCNTDGDLDSLIMLKLARQMSQGHSPCSVYNSCGNKMLFRDCADVYKSGFKRSGVYPIYPVEAKMLVYCDMDTSGGGWTVIQRRMDGSENFNRTYQEYADGFGDLSGEFWLGNHMISLLTSPEAYRLRVDMERFNGQKAYAEYENFNVGPASLKFRLLVGVYSGTAGDSLTRQNGMKFSAWDLTGGHCSRNYGGGGFWFEKCFDGFLNGPYSNVPNITFATGVVWRTFAGYHEGLKTVSMKIRPIHLP